MVFQRRQAEEPTDAAGFYLDRGSRYGRNGVYHRAIQDYTAAIELDPDLVEAWYNRGCAWYEVGELENAIADLTRAIELPPPTACTTGSARWCTTSTTNRNWRRRTRRCATSCGLGRSRSWASGSPYFRDTRGTPPP